MSRSPSGDDGEFPVEVADLGDGADDVLGATVSTEDPIALAAVAAIHSGDIMGLNRLLDMSPWRATARLGDDDPEGMPSTLLPHEEAPLHWAASSDGEALDALLDAGADQWRTAFRLVDRGARTTLAR